MTQWEYIVAPLEEVKKMKKDASPSTPAHLNELGAEGWEAVGLSLKYSDLASWPVVLLKRERSK
jgi:hypothetical protein